MSINKIIVQEQKGFASFGEYKDRVPIQAFKKSCQHLKHLIMLINMYMCV
jgi:hypothetical protein